MAGRIRSTTVSKTLGNKDIQELFSTALGDDSSLDLGVAWPKFKKLRYHTERFIKLLQWLSTRDWLQAHFGAEARRIADYAAALATEHEYVFCDGMPDLDAAASPEVRQLLDVCTPEDRLSFTASLEAAAAEDIELFKARYKGGVESDLVNTAVKTCSEMVGIQAQVADREKLSSRFLTGAGLAYSPIPSLPAANFKAFYQCQHLKDAQREQVLMFLHKLHLVTHEVYEVASSPDVDVDRFVEIIISSIGDVKKHIPRCDDAFKRLESSVDLLRNNFGKYYKDTKHSGNPTMLMENFVLDVAQSSDGAPVKVRQQFRTIISYYQKMAASQPKNPQTDVLFAEINKNFEALQLQEAALGGDGDEAALGDEADEGGGDGGEAAAEPQSETAESLRAQEEGRSMTADERVRHKDGLALRRKQRARARRAADKSIKTYLARPGIPAMSALSKELGDDCEEIACEAPPEAPAADA